MGAVTRRHQGIRHIRKDVTHIKLTIDYDQKCKELVTEYVSQLPDNMRCNFALLMIRTDLKDILKIQDHIKVANDVIDSVLAVLNRYRKQRPVLDVCQSCQNDICRCSKRYLVNEKMNSALLG